MLKQLLLSLVLGSLANIAPAFTQADEEILSVDGTSAAQKYTHTPLMRRGSIESGYAIGSISSWQQRGVLLKSIELNFSLGDFGDFGEQPKNYKFSVVGEGLRKQFMDPKLELRTPVVIHYSRKVFNLGFRAGTRYEIDSIRPALLDDHQDLSSIPHLFTEENAPSQMFSVKRFQGKIVRVQRWGRFTSSCFLTLQLFHDASLTPAYPGEYLGRNERIRLNSEAACQHAENLIQFGRMVTIQTRTVYPSILDFKNVAEWIRLDDAR